VPAGKFARALAPLLGPGDVLLLEGPIGAGKTHFARALIQALLPVPEEVPSPTFTLVQVYDGPGFDIWHADLYRLTHPDEAVELGLAEAFENALCLVEWPERLGTAPPAFALTLRFAHAPDDGRSVEWQAGPRWAKRLEQLA
jgi:tRNA threonylcarbamoyladenosine biosynthesis protein TsaE